MKSSDSSPSASPGDVIYVHRVPLLVITAIVLLRLAVGWHFFREGTKKLAYNPSTGEVRIAFAETEPFLRQAVGPLAAQIQTSLPSFHDWESLLAVPRQSDPGDEPRDAYAAWEERIRDDWKAVVEKFQLLPQLDEEQRDAAEAAYDRRIVELDAYLAEKAIDIGDWRHQLWRLKDWEDSSDARDLPYQAARIAEKRAETKAATAEWISGAGDIERGLYADLRGLLTAAQEADPSVVDQANAVFNDPRKQRMRQLDVAVTSVVIGVGICLMLGMFTRLASLVGIGFIASIIATQPPWVEGANTLVFYYQLVEIAGLGVLLTSGAGRWAGLDFLLRAIAGKCCGRRETTSP